MKKKWLIAILTVVVVLAIALSCVYVKYTMDNNTAENSSEGDFAGGESETSSIVLESSQTDTSQQNTSKQQTTSKPGTTQQTTSKPTSSKQTSLQSTASQKPTQIKDAFDKANAENIYQNAPKGKIHVLMWRFWSQSEARLIQEYEKLTDVEVKVTLVTESNYTSQLVNMVTRKESPDVVMLNTNSFPYTATRVLQPLDSEMFHLNADFWNKQAMDAYKINGRYFGVAGAQSWLCEDLNYVTYYNPSFLKEMGVTTTPYELYKQGNWNWKTQDDIIRKVKSNGKKGIALQSDDLFMYSAGEDFVSYNGSQYTNKIASVSQNSLLVSGWAEVAKLNRDNCLAEFNISDIATTKNALTTAAAYGLCKEGSWLNSSSASKLEAVPVAGPKGKTAYTPAKPRVWGIAKNAKNVEGAAYFLRYILDTSNMKLSSTFHTKQFEEVYNIITKSTTKKTVMYGQSLLNYTDPKHYEQVCPVLKTAAPQNIADVMKSVVQAGTNVNRANQDLARIK